MVRCMTETHNDSGVSLISDLPADGEGPRFVILATNLSTGTLWRFSRPYMRDWRTEPVQNPTLPLAHAVAASSAFPPVLSPCRLTLPGGQVITLTDGGVFDNLGLEPILKRCATVYVSDVAFWPRFNAVYAEAMGDHRPARTVVPVPALHHGVAVEVDVIAEVASGAGTSA